MAIVPTVSELWTIVKFGGHISFTNLRMLIEALGLMLPEGVVRCGRLERLMEPLAGRAGEGRTQGVLCGGGVWGFQGAENGRRGLPSVLAGDGFLRNGCIRDGGGVFLGDSVGVAGYYAGTLTARQRQQRCRELEFRLFPFCSPLRNRPICVARIRRMRLPMDAASIPSGRPAPGLSRHEMLTAACPRGWFNLYLQ
jgi:hypothetical protein